MTNDNSMNGYSFLVDSTPYTVWDSGIKNFNIDYINSINPKFYDFIAHQNYDIIIDKNANKENKQFASILLRNYYAQVLETLFALIFASLQSPHCVLLWMLKYRNKDLYSLVNKINNNESIKIRIPIEDKFSWETIVELIYYYLDDSSKVKPMLVKKYTELLTSFANDFIDQNLLNEYNSVKHGFRLQSGGFTLIGEPLDKKYEDISISHSDYGSAFYVAEKIEDSKNQYCLKYNLLNWNPENMFQGIKFISLLINNIIIFIKYFNQLNDKGLQYKTELPDKISYSPWMKIPGSGAVSRSVKVDIDSIQANSDDQILSSYYDTITHPIDPNK